MNYERIQFMSYGYINMVEGVRLSGGTLTPQINSALDEFKSEIEKCSKTLDAN